MITKFFTQAIFISLLGGAFCPLWAQTDKPNVVFFLVDDLGVTDTGPYGSTFYETPNLDKLAASGIKFNQGYAAAHICSPSRSAIMSGKYPGRTDNTDWFGGARQGDLQLTPYVNRLPLEEVTLAEAFKEAGYSTFFAGKWHLGPTAEFWPENQGFDTNKGGHNKGSPPGGYFSPYTNPRLESGPDGEYLTDRLAEETLTWIESHKEEPFFAFLSFYTVHNPMQPREDLLAKYNAKADTFNFPSTADLNLPFNHTAKQVQNKPDYASMVEAHDEAIGRVLNKLKELGLDSNTLIVYTSDNGGLSTAEGKPTSNYPYKAGKGWMYEGGIREPVFFAWPGTIEAGKETDELLIGTDFYPTLLELVGLPAKPNQHVDGVSLAKNILVGEKTLRKAVYWHYPHYSNQGGRPASTIRMGDLKLIERYEDNSLELYNVTEDVSESINLASQSEYNDIVDLMLNNLHTWRAEVDAKRPPDHTQQPTPAIPTIMGCTDSTAENYYVFATVDDGNCIPAVIEGPAQQTVKFTLKRQGPQWIITAPTNFSVQVHHVSGKAFKSYQNIPGKLNINTQNWPRGVYLIKLGGVTQKIPVF